MRRLLATLAFALCALPAASSPWSHRPLRYGAPPCSAAGGLFGGAPRLGSPSCPIAPVGFVAQTSAYTNVIHQIDAAMPLVGTATTGTPGIELDATNGGISRLVDTAASAMVNHGYGEANYVASGGPNGAAYLSDKSTNYHTGYDSLTFTAAQGDQIFAAPNNPFTWTFVLRQTASGGTEFLKVQSNYTVNDGSNSPLRLLLTPTGSDGSLHVQQNDEQVITRSETAGATTALNTWEVVTVQSVGGVFSIRRNGVTTLATPNSAGMGVVGGWGASHTLYFEIMNNSNTDLVFAEFAAGAQSNAAMNAEQARLATRYGLGTMATITDGPSSTIAPDAPDLTVSDAVTIPNYPTSDTAPTKGSTPTLPGLTLGGSPVSLAYWDFTTGGTTSTRALFNAQTYDHGLFGNWQTNQGQDGIEGDGWTYNCSYNNTCSNWTRSRSYAASSAYNLITFNGADGVNLGVVCGKNNTAAGCLPGNIHGPYVRFPTVVLRGDIVHYIMRGHNSPYWYAGMALYSGAERTPGPGGQTLNYNTWNPTFDSCYGEIDGFDGYMTSGVPTGQQLKSGVLPRYGYYTNSVNGGTNSCFTNRPKTIFAANGSNFSYFANPSGLPYWRTLGSTLYDGFHDYVVWMRDDGTHLVEFYRDGVRYAEQYYEHDTTSTNTVPGWSINIPNQTVPNFNPHTTVTPNDGGPINGGAWSTDFRLVEVIRGATITASGTEDANGTASGGDNISLSYY